MNALRLLLATLICLCAVACAPLDRQPDAQADAGSAERQVLVMLRAAPPHFRPDVAYGGNYDSRVGRDARRRVAEGLASQYGLRILDSWLMPALGVDCFVMQAPDRASLVQLVEQLRLDPRVESIQSMNTFHVLAHNDPLYQLQPGARLWHLADIHKITTGRNVRVAEVDTGVEIDHPDLAGRVARTQNFVNGRPYAAEMHGTAVAGIIAARADDGIGIAGIAPESRLMALRACWQSTGRGPMAVCTSFTLAKALQFALDERAEVINLSVGGPRDALLARLIDTAMSRGVTVVGAADPGAQGGGFPASHHGVLAVAGDDGHDASDDFLLAPGQDVPTTIPGQRWGFVSGSSFAAAHVTGLVALLREIAPKLSQEQVRTALATRAIPSTASQRGIVDACSAVAAVGGTCACGCAFTGAMESSLRR